MSFFGAPVTEIRRECREVRDDTKSGVRELSTRHGGVRMSEPLTTMQRDVITLEPLRNPVLKYGIRCYNASSLVHQRADPVTRQPFTPSELNEILVANGLRPEYNANALFDAAIQNDVNGVFALLAHGVPVDAAGENGTTALLSAPFDGRAEVARLLIERGANVNATSGTGFTALMHAAWSRNLDVVNILIDRGALLDLMNIFDMTAMMFAAHNGSVDIVDTMLAHGATVDKSRNGFTALMCAAGSGQVEVVKLLIAHGADVNAVEGGGSRVLTYATLNHRAEVAAVLIASGAI